MHTRAPSYSCAVNRYHIRIDFVGLIHCKSQQGSRYILTISDYFSKFVLAIPCKTREAVNVVTLTLTLTLIHTLSSPEVLHSMWSNCLRYITVENGSQTKYICAAFSMALLTCFAIDISNDTVDFPTSFCKVCRRVMRRVQEAAVKNMAFRWMVKTCKVNILT